MFDFDGVGWAAGEIVVFMLVASVIGFAIGWIFGRWLQKGSLAAEYETKLLAERRRAGKIETRLDDRRVDLDGSGEVAPVAVAESTAEESQARMAEVAERTAGGAAVPDDDLKRIRGIGPKLEQDLKGFGITSFRQIASFQPDDIAVVTVALGAFKGRIERDDWMSGAAEQHIEKYGEPV